MSGLWIASARAAQKTGTFLESELTLFDIFPSKKVADMRPVDR
jgi:hypothetical protein